MKRVLIPIISMLLISSCTKPKTAPTPEERAEAAKTAGEGHEKGESKGDSDEVEITAEAQERSGIVVTPAATASMAELLQTTGTVQPIDSTIAQVRPLTRGRLLEVLVKAGDRV